MPLVPPAQPQPVLAPLTPAAIFLVVTIDEGGEAPVHDALPEISGLVRAIGFRDPTKHLSVIASIGSEAWDRLFEGARPAELHPFVELDGPRHTAPTTPGDLLFHVRAETLDVCFELANRILRSMGWEKYRSRNSDVLSWRYRKKHPTYWQSEPAEPCETP